MKSKSLKRFEAAQRQTNYDEAVVKSYNRKRSPDTRVAYARTLSNSQQNRLASLFPDDFRTALAA